MTRVVVAGAGLAGLIAATDLASHGVDVIVLEARNRVGGRTFGVEVAPGGWIDGGGAYLGERHCALTETIAELGLKTVPTGMTGDSRFLLGGKDVTLPGRFPPLNGVAIGEMFDLLDEIVRAVRLDEPWTHQEWDRVAAADWAREHLSHEDARMFFPLYLGEMMAADPADVSVLHMGFYLRSGGGLRYLNAFEGGAQESRVDGGAHQLCEQLAAGLPSRVRLQTPVRAIHQLDRPVVFAGGESYPCDAVIVAIPPLLANAIEFRPRLKAPRATARTAGGRAIKVHLVYPEPIWRAHGLSGWSVNEHGPLLSTVDDSPADGSAGVLTGFVTGREASRFAHLAPTEQEALAIAQAARLFPRLPAPIAVHVTNWVLQEYSRGCYAALFGPGDWSVLGGGLTQPHGRVHWAGTETSTEFFGLMEGAIRSGHRAAAEILTL